MTATNKIEGDIMMAGKILIVGPYPPPFGGIASQISNTVPYLVSEDFEEVHTVSWGAKDVLSPDGKFFCQRVHLNGQIYRLFSGIGLKALSLGIQIATQNRLSPSRCIKEVIRALFLIDLIDTRRFSLVHYFMLDEGIAAILVRHLRPQIRQVFTIYGEIFDKSEFYKSRPRLVSAILNTMDHKLASSCYCARSPEALGIAESFIEPVYYGVDLEKFHPNNDGEATRKSLGIKENQKVVLFFARLMAEMGADIMCKAAPLILDSNPDAVVIVAGANGEETENLRAVAKRYESRFFLKVNVPFSEVPGLYAACDILLAPTREKHACMGMSIKEAMASGKVCICSRSGGIPEAVIDGETGILLGTGEDLHVDPVSLSHATGLLLDDTTRRIDMGVSARKRAEDIFDNAFSASRIIEIYKEQLGKYHA
jgi:phosphatidylinositol alpha-1,6-mannosyltransferase